MAHSQASAKRGRAMPVKPWDFGEAFCIFFNVENVTASTPYVLIDLSDTTNFPHEFTTELILKGLRVHAEPQSSGVYDLWFGVVTELDATNGTAEWLEVIHLEGVSGVFAQSIPFDSLPLGVASQTLEHVLTNVSQAGHTNWQNDVYLTSPGGSAIPEVGDLVLWIEEVSDAGGVDVAIGVDYDAQ